MLIYQKDFLPIKVIVLKLIRKLLILFCLINKTSNPVLAIELDDSSHLRTDRQTRDNFVNKILSKT